MEKAISKLAGLGVAGLVLAVVIGTTGFAGAAALTASLAILGGPFGMLGGLAVLGIISIAAAAIAKYGIDQIALGVVQKLLQQGKSKEQIISEINAFPIISGDLKAKLRDFVNRA